MNGLKVISGNLHLWRAAGIRMNESRTDLGQYPKRIGLIVVRKMIKLKMRNGKDKGNDSLIQKITVVVLGFKGHFPVMMSAGLVNGVGMSCERMDQFAGTGI